MITRGIDNYQNKVWRVRATEMLYNGLSQTSSLCPNSSRGSYCHNQTWRRSRRRTSSGLTSEQGCSDAPVGNRASRPTEDEITEGRLLASSPLAMFLHFVMLFWITGFMQKQTSSVKDVKMIRFPCQTFKIKCQSEALPNNLKIQ